MIQKRILFFFLLFELGGFVCAWHSLAQPLVVRLSGEPQTLDWNRAHSSSETYVLLNLMEGLLEIDEHLKIQPALAKKWEVASGGKLYRFWIRQDVYWSDGKKLIVKHFLDSWKRLLSPLTASPYAYFLFDIKNAKAFYEGKIKDFSKVGIRIKGKYLLEVELEKPLRFWKYIPTFWVTFPIRIDLIQKYGTAWTKPGHLVTLGPYELRVYELGSKLVLTQNMRYYRKAPTIKKIIFQIIKSDQTALRLYQKRKLDVLTALPFSVAKSLKKRKDFHLFPYLKTVYLGFSQKRLYVSKKEVRRALIEAIDRKKMLVFLGGGKKIAQALIPQEVLSFPEKALGILEDVQKGKKRLQKLGFSNINPLKLSFFFSNSEQNLLLAQYLVQQWNKAFQDMVVIDLRPYPEKMFFTQLDLGLADMFLGAWAADYPHPSNYLNIFRSLSGNNRFSFQDKYYDHLLDQAKNAKTKQTAQALFLKAQKYLLQEKIVLFPLYWDTQESLIQDTLERVVFTPLRYLFLRKASWKKMKRKKKVEHK